MTNHLSRVSIKMQIALIGLIAMLGVAAVGGFYVLRTGALQTHQTAADQASRRRLQSDALMITLLDLRRAEKDFLLRRLEKHVERHGALSSTFTGELDALKAAEHGPAQAEGDAATRAIAAEFGTYKKHFDKVVLLQRQLGLNEKEGLQGRLRTSVHAVEATLQSVDDTRLLASMLTMRRHEKDFIIRGDRSYIDKLDATAAEFRKALESSTITGTVHEDILAHLDAYLADVHAFAAAKLEMASEVEGLSAAFAKLEPMVLELRTGALQAAELADAESAQTRAGMERGMLWAVACSLALVGALALGLGRAISRPILDLDAAMRKLAANDLSVEVAGVGRRDEIGAMARSVRVFKDSLIAKENTDAAMVAENAAKASRARRLDELAAEFEATMSVLTGTLNSAAIEMEATAESLTSTAGETNNQSIGVAGAAEQTSANVQTVAAATDELTRSIQEIADRVSRSADFASAAVAKARGTDQTVSALSAGAHTIAEVVTLINSIASQTNLLALNATIEAARAGEAGKGFAVVAAEVKALAGQTTKATDEIAAQIAAIQSATERAVGAVREIGETIGEMSTLSASVAAAVQEQGAATREIARSIEEAARGTEAVTSSIVRVKQGAGETGAAATQVLGAARDLAKQSERLSAEVSTFLSRMKAA